jgi:hypothetical protein
MKTISLTQGKITLVDDDDFDYLNQFKWCAHKDGNTFYAIRTVKKPKRALYRMHRCILSAGSGSQIDHIDGDGLNNQKSNLRFVTTRINQQNQHVRKTSAYPGVYRHSNGKGFVAKIEVCKKSRHLCYSTNEKFAGELYDAFSKIIEKSKHVLVGGCCND